MYIEIVAVLCPEWESQELSERPYHEKLAALSNQGTKGPFVYEGVIRAMVTAEPKELVKVGLSVAFRCTCADVTQTLSLSIKARTWQFSASNQGLAVKPMSSSVLYRLTHDLSLGNNPNAFEFLMGALVL